jgi:glycosyltransferase involved in cell wall biosynthesis
VAHIISDAECGLNREPDDVEGMAEMFQMLKKEKETRRKMGERARAYVEKYYAKDVVLEKYEDLLVSLRGAKQL